MRSRRLLGLHAAPPGIRRSARPGTRARPSRSGSRAGPRRPRPRARRRRAARSPGCRTPRSTAATAAPVAPVPEDMRLPHAALEDPRADRAVAGRAARTTRWCGSGTARGARSAARARQVELLELRRLDLDRALRVADRDVLEARTRARRPSSVPRAVLGPARGSPPSAGCARPMSTVQVSRPGDPRADLARPPSDRERVAVGPAAPAQVHDRLARAVARQLGLGAVRVEDPQRGDEAALVGLATAAACRRSRRRCAARRARGRARA